MLVGLTELYAPSSYWLASQAEREEVCNGCGRSGWKGKLVPNTMYGLPIKVACDIHDWMYRFGVTEEDRQIADRVFLNNLLRLIEAKGGLLTGLRRYRAMTYYNAVTRFGGPAFWANKNQAQELGLVYT